MTSSDDDELSSCFLGVSSRNVVSAADIDDGVVSESGVWLGAAVMLAVSESAALDCADCGDGTIVSADSGRSESESRRIEVGELGAVDDGGDLIAVADEMESMDIADIDRPWVGSDGGEDTGVGC